MEGDLAEKDQIEMGIARRSLPHEIPWFAEGVLPTTIDAMVPEIPRCETVSTTEVKQGEAPKSPRMEKGTHESRDHDGPVGRTHIEIVQSRVERTLQPPGILDESEGTSLTGGKTCPIPGPDFVRQN
jgi:hypothetical protein